MGEKKVDNLLAGIEQSKSRGLRRVLAGLGIRHVGARSSRILSEQFGNMDALMRATVEALSDLPDVGPVTAESVHQFLHSASGRHVIDELTEAGVDLTQPQPATVRDENSPVAGKTLVITGSFEHYDRKQLSDILQQAGAKVTSSVSKKTDAVIAGSSPGSKLEKAEKLGIDVWDEAQLEQLLKTLER